MATLLTKRSNTSGSVPLAAQLTNSTGGAELAVNTADKRLYVKDSGGTVVELGISPGSMPTYASGTANGVTYLNGSKVLTSGSALTFDGTTLANINSDGTGFSTQSAASNFSILRLGTDSVNGYAFFQSGKSGTGTTLPFAWRQDSSELMRLTSTGLGIGTSSPNTKLQVNGNAVIGNGTIGAPASGYQLRVTNDGSEYYDFGRSSSTGYFTINASQASPYRGFIWAYGGTSQMTLDSSGNLGIGTSSPQARLHINSGAGSTQFRMGPNSTSSDRALINYNSTTNRFTIDMSGNDAVVVDGSGNLGLGVTPSAWASNFKANQIGQGAYIAGRTDAVALYMGSNGFWNGSSDRYIANGFATDYYQATGQHIWRTAASGTAGNAITFTQAMTLDANANLGVGVTSMAVPSTSRRGLQVSNGTSGGMILLSNSTTESDNPRIFGSVTTQYDLGFSAGGSTGFINWYTNGSERARIDSSGNLLVGTTSANAGSRLRIKTSGTTNATYGLFVANNANAEMFSIEDDGRWNTGATTNSPYNYTTANAANMFVTSAGFLQRSTSSLKYKKNVQDATHGLADVLKLRAVTYQGKAEEDSGKTFGGLIAEEVHAAGLTEFVQYAEDGTPDALAYGNMVSLAFKAIQELKAEFDAYKATHP